MKFSIKTYLPYILGLFIVSSLVFFPELQGKKLGGGDAVQNICAAKEVSDYAKKGEKIFWTNRMFSGMPVYAMSGDVSGNYFFMTIWVDLMHKVPFFLLLCHFIVMLCSFASLKMLGVNRNLSFILSIALGLNTWLLASLWASHVTKVYDMAFLPILISGMICYLKKDKLYGLLIFTLALNLFIGFGHYQIIYYGVLICAIVFLYIAYEAYKNNSTAELVKKTTILVVLSIICTLTHLSSLFIMNDYNKETMRGGKTELIKPEANSTAKGGGLDINYAFSWSYSVPELVNFYIPDAMGGANSYKIKTSKSKLGQAVNPNEDEQVLPFYWGLQPFTGAPNYLGAGIFFLFIFSFMYWNNKLKFVYLSIFFLSLFMGLGKHFMGFNEILFNQLPLYNKFRTPTMAFSILNMISILMIGGALQSLLAESKINQNELIKKLKTSFWIFLGFMVLGYILVSNEGYTCPNDSQVFGNNAEALKLAIEDRTSLLKSDWIRSILISMIIAGSLFYFIKDKLSKKIFIIVIGLVLFFDLFTVYKRYLNSDDFQKMENSEEAVPNESYNAYLEQDKSHYRLLNSTNQNMFNDNTDGYRHNNIGGYSPAKLYRYQDLIDVHLSKGNMPVLNMLNTKYYIVENQGQKFPQQNPEACGNAWFVNEVKFAKSANEEMDSIGTFNPKQTAWVDQRYKSDTKFNGNTDPSAKIEMTKYHPEKMEYTSTSSSGGFVVFSEIWYKGNEDWKVFVDGKEQKMVRTNYLLRGVYIPAGSHKVEMIYKSEKVGNYMLISQVFTTIMLLICLGIVYILYKKNRIGNNTIEVK